MRFFAVIRWSFRRLIRWFSPVVVFLCRMRAVLRGAFGQIQLEIKSSVRSSVLADYYRDDRLGKPRALVDVFRVAVRRRKPLSSSLRSMP